MSESNNVGKSVVDAGKATIATAMQNVISPFCTPSSVVIISMCDENGTLQQGYISGVYQGFFTVGTFNWLSTPFAISWAIIN